MKNVIPFSNAQKFKINNNRQAPGHKKLSRSESSLLREGLQCKIVCILVAEISGVSHTSISNARRGSGKIARARQMAMYLAHVGCGLSQNIVAHFFRRDRKTVAYAARVIEDLRDDPEFDARLDRLETQLHLISKDFARF